MHRASQPLPPEWMTEVGFWLSAGGLPQAHLRDRDLHLPLHLDVGKDRMLSVPKW